MIIVDHNNDNNEYDNNIYLYDDYGDDDIAA